MDLRVIMTSSLCSCHPGLLYIDNYSAPGKYRSHQVHVYYKLFAILRWQYGIILTANWKKIQYILHWAESRFIIISILLFFRRNGLKTKHHFRWLKHKFLQWNPVNTDIKGTRRNVRIIRLSTLSSLVLRKKKTSCTHFLSIQRLKQTCLRQQNVL